MSLSQFDRAKMRAVILRAIGGCTPSDMGAVKLNKVLYFVDMIHYAHFRQAVTGATYRKRPNGPTTDQLLFVLREMQHDGQVKIDDVEYHGYWKKQYTPLTPEPAGVLNEEEQALVDDVVDFVCRQNSAKTISDYSHQMPWEMATDGGVIPYSTAMLLFPMQVSPEAFDAASMGVSEIEVARSNASAVGGLSVSDFRSRVLASIGQH
jgi:Protein of unknown function (DUF4065)